ncbi:MAG: SDR family oxidoreductase [Thiogranum sp.]|nr:SDR family oxidoreductase [Thiogranum sp.]
MNTVLIIGCGDTGRRVAALHGPTTVCGVARTDESIARMIERGIGACRLDLDTAFGKDDLPARDRELYYFAPPPASGNHDTRMTRVCAVLQGENLPRKLVYISTTAVYGDCGRAWIDESATLRPMTARGRRRLDAEQQLLCWGERNRVPVVVLRVPGIYGPDRLPLERLRQGLPVLCINDSPYSNRIHVHDLARICRAAMRHGGAGQVYNVSDGHPSTMTEYFNTIADRFGLPRPPTIERSQAEQQLTAPMLSYLNESKRIINTRMLKELKVVLDYPDLDAGLRSPADD